MNGRDTILIVDDQEVNRMILAESFRNQYKVAEAADGDEALQYIYDHKDELAAVLLDIVMPRMDGFEVMEHLAKDQIASEVPVFFITAADSHDTIVRGYSMGVVDVISKPFFPEFIRRRIGNVVELYQNRQALKNIVDQQVVELKAQAEKLTQQARELREMNSSIIEMLSTIVEFRDCESGEHVKRIRDITRELLNCVMEMYPEYDLNPEKISLLCDAAVMHDVGKISIPDAILKKPGRLTQEEFALMKEHTTKGCDILDTIPNIKDSELYKYCYDICRHHHERWDGNGYPDGLKGDEISIQAQVVSLADVYDALVSQRVYKGPYSHETAVQMIKNGECGVFNPKLLACFEIMAEKIKSSLY